MTDEDFAEMVLSRARMNMPIPPLQQRKLRVLLNWVRSIQIETNSCDTSSPPPNASEGFEVGKSNTARYKVSVRKDDISYIPNDWEDKFYRDLPRLKKELKQMGGESNVSDWANGYLSLRWLFCRHWILSPSSLYVPKLCPCHALYQQTTNHTVHIVANSNFPILVLVFTS